MEIRQKPSSKGQIKPKLPIKVDWWRDDDVGKGRDNYAQIESLESPTPEIMPPDSQDIAIQRNTTTVSSGEIDISTILFPIHNDSERQIYENNCERFQCPTSRKFGKTLDGLTLGIHSDDVNMAHYGLTNMGVRATAISISNMSQCSVIDLRGNTLTSSSLGVLVSVMKKSPVTEINLSSTGISKFGPQILSKWIATSMRIKTLYLRDNKFDDDDGMKLFEAAGSNRSIIHLDVAENLFCIRCGDALKKLLEENDVLEVLNLSWNQLRSNATMSITKGLKKNNGLKNLILSFNGLDYSSTRELGLALEENDCLQNLELVSTRIGNAGFVAILSSLQKNHTLKSIVIGRNLITDEAAISLLELLEQGKLIYSDIKVLDFTDNILKSDFQLKIESSKDLQNVFVWQFGYGVAYDKKKSKRYNPVDEDFQFLKTYIEENRINLKESKRMTNDQFKEAIKEANIPLSDDRLDRLVEYLDSELNGSIDISELLIGAADPAEEEKHRKTN